MKKICSDKKYLILGVDGFLGGKLFETFSEKGLNVQGTSKRRSKNKKILFLDTQKNNSISRFAWKNFNVIIDCIGSVKYDGTLDTIEKNFYTNTVRPLEIIDKLSKNHKYYYCSTHATLLPWNQQNSYTLSKLFFEKSLELAKDINAHVTCMRIPALFDHTRNSGLLYTIKESAKKKKVFKIDFISSMWHTMYLPRAVDIISSVVLADKDIDMINIGYPAPITINLILDSAMRVFKGQYVKIMSKKEEQYTPDIRVQKNFYTMHASAFTDDLEYYFSS